MVVKDFCPLLSELEEDLEEFFLAEYEERDFLSGEDFREDLLDEYLLPSLSWDWRCSIFIN